MRPALLVLAVLLASRADAVAPDSVELSPARRVRASFLAEGVGARAVGMGEAFTASADDASAVSWNPGGLGQIRTVSAVMMYDAMGEEISLSYAALAVPLPVGVVGLGLTALSYGAIEVRDASGDLAGTESPMDAAVTVSYSLKNPGWLGGWSGLAVEAVKEDEGDTLFGASLGSVIPLATGLRAGWAIQHAGPATDGFSLPAVVKVGCAWQAHGMVVLGLDGGYPLVSREPWVALGAELVPRQELTARLGYRWRGDHEDLGGFNGLTAGIGIRPPGKGWLSRVSLDYAYQSAGEFMSSHRVSLAYGLPPAPVSR